MDASGEKKACPKDDELSKKSQGQSTPTEGS